MKQHSGRLRRVMMVIFITLFALISVFPVLSMSFYDGAENTDNRTLAAAPQLVTEEGINSSFGTQAETWLSEHVGYRQEIITAWNLAQYRLFGTSGVPKVTAGKDGWLFFTEAVEDTRGKTLYTERACSRIAKTVELMNEYAEENGSLFIFAVAPNKTSVYPQYLKGGTYISPETNLSRINELLENKEYYVNLHELFTEKLDSRTEQYYYRYDSHWNNLGALEVYRALQQNISQRIPGYTFDAYEDIQTEQSEHTGDLGKMMLPGSPPSESEQSPVYEGEYTSKRPITDPLYFQIETQSQLEAPSLYVCRDSFGSALIEPLSSNFSHVFYSTSLPYKLSDAVEYDIVIVEIVERNMLNIVADAPEVQSPERTAPQNCEKLEGTVEYSLAQNGEDISISGVIPEDIALETSDSIYIEVIAQGESSFFEAYPICKGDAANDRGFCALLAGEHAAADEYILHIGTPENTISCKMSAAN